MRRNHPHTVLRRTFCLLLWAGWCPALVYANNFLVLNKQSYHSIVADARADIKSYFAETVLPDPRDLNAQADSIVEELRDTPYLFRGAMGEGDWQPASLAYQGGAVHIAQDPVYRLDGLDCQTFVQVAIAALQSSTLDQFDENMVKVAYGAVKLNGPDLIHYYNRNHFVELDFNPVNQQRGFLQDVTSYGVLAQYAKTTQAAISKRRWLERRRVRPEKYVHVLDAENGDAMAKRFTQYYKHLSNKLFKDKLVGISYLPKTSLAIRLQDGSYVPNEGLFDLIPAPAIAEIVCDAKSWVINGKLIKDAIGTNMSVSHFGLLYRKTFHYGDTIYQKITCGLTDDGEKQCLVKPVICQKTDCKELMFAHATDMYPARYYWYKNQDGSSVCSPVKPKNGEPYTTCNRVESTPFFNYLTNYQFGSYWYMNAPYILGVHIEKLIKPSF